MHWKKSPLVTYKILRLFVNTLTVNDKHYLLKRENLTQPIQMQLSQKQKNLSIFFWISKSILNFKHLPTKDHPRSWCISGNIGSEKYGYINVLKDVFQRTLRKRTLQMGRKTVAIWMAASLQYLLITVKVAALEKVSFSDTKNPKTLC